MNRGERKKEKKKLSNYVKIKKEKNTGDMKKEEIRGERKKEKKKLSN